MSESSKSSDKRILESLSEAGREILRTRDVVADAQLRGLDVDALGLPPEDLLKLKEALKSLPSAEGVPDLSRWCGVPPCRPDEKEEKPRR